MPAPYVNSVHQDAALTALQNSITAVWLCTNVPADYNDANNLKAVEIAITNDPSTWTIANGDINGRKLRYAGGSDYATKSGTVNCAVFVGNGAIQFINNITTTAIANGGKVTVNAFDVWEVGNPS